MSSLWQDLRYGARMLAKSPGFTLVAILTLALGIGANTAIFSVVYGVLLRPLPYPQPDRIVQITISYKGQPDYPGFTASEFDFWQHHSEPFSALGASHGQGFNLQGSAESVRVRALHVSRAYFDVFGIQPALGRNFSADEDSAGGPNVAILSYGLWRAQFGGSPDLIGKSISLNGTPFTVVGIMPSGFASVPAADLWTTLAQTYKSVGFGTNYKVIGRLKDGVTREQADAYLGAASAAFLQQFRTHMISVKERPYVAFHPTPLAYAVTFDYHTPLLALFGAIGFVLLIACVNVASLLLARGVTRTREIAVRTALGAGRTRVMRLLLTESLLLAFAGGALGVVLASWGLRALLSLAPTDLPRAHDISLDAWALGFSAIISIVCGIVFGIAPAFQASKTDLNDALKESTGQTSAGIRRQRMRDALIVAEVALSVALLAGASLLVATFANLLQVNPGFDPHSLLSVGMWPSGGEFKTSEDMVRFDREVIQRVERIPGVRSAAIVVGGLPLELGGNLYFDFKGQKQGRGVSADYREITREYFQTLGVPLQQGRFFSDSDSATTQRVAIINQELAQEYFRDRSPVGQHLKQDTDEFEIVGVVGNVRSFLNEPAPPTVFVPNTQADIGGTKGFLGWFPGCVVVRIGQDPLSVSKEVVNAVHTTDSAVPVGDVRSMEEVLSTALAFQRFSMTLMSIFAGLAVVLAAVGIYGVMAYSVAQRTREIGIRMALGALAPAVWRMVVGWGMLLAGVGIVLGLAGAAGLTRLLADQLYGVKPADPIVLAITAIILGGVAFLACWIPGRRAARVDPMVALRHE